jgi:peptide/nickel transport system substrate-binding protein
MARKLLAVLLTVFITLSFVSISQAKSHEKPKYGGTFKLVLDLSPGGNPGYPAEIRGDMVATTQLFCESILRQHVMGEYRPWLATSYELTQDGKSITFKLRQGVKFHDGTDFNAQAVAWNFQKWMDGGRAPTWKSIEVLDKYTVRVNMTKWRNTSFNTFTGGNFMISPTASEKNGLEWTRSNPVGTGPFLFDYFKRDVGARGKKNPNYWNKDLPYVDAYEISYVPDQMTQKALMQSKQADALVVELGKVAAEMLDMGMVAKTQHQATFSLFPSSAAEDSPFRHQKVREAVEYAIDREAIAKGLGYGMWQAPYQIAPPDNVSFDPNFVGRKYDPEKAKQLLAEAGYPNGFKTTLYPAPVMINKDVNVAVQSYLKKAGVDARIEYWEHAAYAPVMNRKTWEGLIMQPIPAFANWNFTLWLLFYSKESGWFVSTEKSDRFMESLDESLNSLMPDVDLMRKVNMIAYEDCMVIPVYEGGKGYATQKYVRGGGFVERGFPVYFNPEDVWLSK